jgi:hypothetical protein
MKSMLHRQIEEYAAAKAVELAAYVLGGGRIAVVKAPPGSGKTHLLMQTVKAARKEKQRVAVATQTRSQADDICRRLVAEFGVKPIRFAAASSAPMEAEFEIVTNKKDLPDGPCVVVGTSAKWGMIQDPKEFDVLFVDEAWQLSWADFMLLGQVSGRFVLIGDPGQIPPVVTIDTGRWETSPRAPHHPAPEHILRQRPRDLLSLDLPATRRLPHDTVEYIGPFYDFHFGALAQPGERLVRVSGASRDGIDAALDRLAAGSVAAITLPTPPEGPPLEDDSEVAELAVDVVKRLLKREAHAVFGKGDGKLTPLGIGMCATHRVMNARMELLLPTALKGEVDVDTPERWQGLERPVMVIAHPLSGVTHPSAFDLETGRLCVMASRHKAGLVIVTRDHIGATLDSHLPVAEQPVGRPDVSGRGHHQNGTFWGRLLQNDRVVEA